MNKPKELYRFVEGSNVWTVTSADVEESYDGEVYVCESLGRNQIESKNEMSRANIEVSFGIDSQIARRWIKSIVDEVVTLSIFSKDGNSVSVVWKGRLSSVKPTISEIVLVFESIFTSLRRPGLQARYQRNCPHVLYGRGCNLNKEDFAISGKVEQVSENIVKMPIAAAYPDGYFSAGIIEAPDGSLRFITSHIGDTLVLIRNLEPLNRAFAESGYGLSYGEYYGGVVARIFPGCDRTKETCKDKFNNLANNGGFPFIPLKNPFNGGSIV